MEKINIKDYHNTKDFKELSKSIDKFLIPHENEKKQNAEISTPYELRKEMLDKIPEDFWKTPKKVFEPCSGKCGFLIDIIDRFMDGLKDVIKDEEERYKTVIEECLYYSDINKTNIFISKLLLNPFNKYKLNYNEGDTLKLDIKDKWGIEGFDAVIGNPPYTTTQETNSRESTPLYNLFIEKYIDITAILIYVIPSRWFVTGKGLNMFRDNIKKRDDIQYIIHNDDSKEWFGNNVDIKGGCCIIVKNKDHKGYCNFNNIIYNLNEFDIILNPKNIKFIKIFEKYKNITEIFMGRYYNIQTNDKRLKDVKDINDIDCYVSVKQSKNRIAYIAEKNRDKDLFWKVISPVAVKGAYSGFNELFILNENELHNDSYISFRLKNEEEAKSLLSYLQTPIINKLLSIRKISQTISRDTCKYIPLVPFNTIWSNQKIYNYFNLSNEEIKYIENNI